MYLNKKKETRMTVDTKRDTGFINCERFQKLIIEKNCFICGSTRSAKKFNDEHILPRWILKKYNLFEKQITLPNNKRSTYAKYKIPCCEDCNSLLGTKLERPVSNAFKNGYIGIKYFLENGGLTILYQWLCLIFLKTHLKDTMLKSNPDQRILKKSLAELMEYDFARFHHIFCIARSVYSSAEISPHALGSILVVRAKKREHIEPFDYADLFCSNSLLLRYDNFCIIAVLDDAQGALCKFNKYLNLIIDEESSPIQLREILGHLSYINIVINERPEFYTKIDSKGSIIETTHPPKLKDELRSGRRQFILDEHGKFDTNSFEIMDSPSLKEQ
jgi:hypothetical protein